MYNEPKITINGVELTSAQSMTMRVAITSFQSRMMTEGLGDDERGRFMSKAYSDRSIEIFTLMFKNED